MKGIPFEDDLQDLIEALYAWKTGKDLDIDVAMMETLSKYTSPFIAETLIKGIPYSALNIDMSGRLGLGSVLPDSGSDALGVWWDMLVERPKKALTYANEGDAIRALAEIMPAFIKNPITAYLWSEDGVRTQKGRKVIDANDVSDVDKALKFFGFTSSDISRKREQVYATDRLSKAVDGLRSKYYGRISKALSERKRRIDSGDTRGADEMSQEVQNIMAEVAQYNETVPVHEKIILNSYTIKKKFKEEIEGAKSRPVRKQARSRAQELNAIYNWKDD
jgi:hypothetical protein